MVGPWRGEVGFEALYWLPWLAAVRDALELGSADLIPITRGGAGAWYGNPQGLELYEMRSVAEVRVANRIQVAQTGMLKQTTVSAWDRRVLRDAADTLGLRHPAVLHPAWMYQRLTPFWAGTRGLTWLQAQLRFQPVPVPEMPWKRPLPPRFAAVRFYWRAGTFAPDHLLESFVPAVVAQVASHVPVVLLDPEGHFDEHHDLTLRGDAQVTRLRDYLDVTPATNLAAQSAVIAQAAAFVGTYGGMAQLALRLGRPSVSFVHGWAGTAWAHRHLSDALAQTMGVPWHVLPVGNLALLQQVVPQVVLHATPPVPKPLDTAAPALAYSAPVA